MGTIVFTDPNDNEEKAWESEERNENYRVIKEFLNQPQKTFSLFVSSLSEPPTEGFFVPQSSSLHVLPAIHLRKIHAKGESRRGSISLNARLILSNSLNSMKGLSLSQDWAIYLGMDLINLIVLPQMLEVAVANYLVKTGHKPRLATPVQWFEEEGERLDFLRIALDWSYWELQGLKWFRRTSEAIEFGSIQNMTEDNFRKKCKKAGLLKPAPRQTLRRAGRHME